MFDISLTEIMLIATVAVIFIGPKEFPVVVRALAKTIMQCKNAWHEVKLAMRDVARESGVDDIRRELEDEYERDMQLIEGDDGTMYKAYDMGELALDEVIGDDIIPDADTTAASATQASIKRGDHDA